MIILPIIRKNMILQNDFRNTIHRKMFCLESDGCLILMIRKISIYQFCFAIYKKSGAVVSDTPFFSTLTDGVSMGCRKQHYDCVIRYLYEDDDLSDQVYALSAMQFSGIILC